MLQVASLRCDVVLAKFYNLSRNEASEAFRSGKVFVNGKNIESTSLMLKEQDMITVRGRGRFKLERIGDLTKKGKTNIILIY